MQRARFAAIGTVFFALPLVALAADAKAPNFTEGQWDTTITVQMPGMPFQMPPFTTSTCVTKKDLVPQTSQPGQDCKVKSQKVTGDSVEWAVQCKDDKGNATDGTGKITYKGGSFAGTMKMTITQPGQAPMEMSYTMNGKRTGDCKKEPASK